MSCCGGTSVSNGHSSRPDTVKLAFLYLDETVCKPCGGTGKALDEAAGIVAAPLAAMGLRLDIERIHVATREDAIAHQLITSPTIRINGIDIDPGQTEGACESCGDIAGGQTTVTCRTWHWNGEAHTSAPTGLIVEAILRAAAQPIGGATCCADDSQPEAYTLPQNLEGFFQARRDGAQSCC